MISKKLIKNFCGGLCAKRKAQGAKRIIQLTLCAKRQAPSAFPLAAGGKKVVITLFVGLLLCGVMLFAVQSDITLHQQGKKAIYEKDWRRAARLFQQLDARFPGSIFHAEALYWLAYSLEKQDKKLESFELLNRLIDTYPKNEWVDDAKILRIRICTDLITRGSPRYRQYIMEAVQTEDDEHMDLQMVALDALIRLDRRQALFFLEKLYKKSKNPGIKENIIFILRRFGENKMISRLAATKTKIGKITIKKIKEAYTYFHLYMNKVTPPRLERRVEPVYPREALEEGVSGEVNLKILIDKKGDVSYVKVDKETHPLLAAAAEKALRQWKFFPYTRKGKRMNIGCVVTINFSIEKD